MSAGGDMYSVHYPAPAQPQPNGLEFSGPITSTNYTLYPVTCPAGQTVMLIQDQPYCVEVQHPPLPCPCPSIWLLVLIMAVVSTIVSIIVHLALISLED